MPFRLSLPKGPASRTIGGDPAKGPVIEGVGSAVGASAGAAGAAAGGAAGAVAGAVACGWSAGLGAGASCATTGEAENIARLAPSSAVHAREKSLISKARFLQSVPRSSIGWVSGSMTRDYERKEASARSEEQ